MEKLQESRLALLQFLFLLFFGLVMAIMGSLPFLLISSTSLIVRVTKLSTEKSTRVFAWLSGIWLLIMAILFIIVWSGFSGVEFYNKQLYIYGPQSIGGWLHLW